MDSQKMMALAAVIGGLLLFCAIPPIVAWARASPDRRTIAKLAPLSLLSFALWFALIVWAASGKRDDGLISRYITKMQDSGVGKWLIAGLVVLGLVTTALAVALQ